MGSSIKRMFELAGRYKSRMIAAVVLAILSVAAGMIPYFIIQRIIMEFVSGVPDSVYLRNLAVFAGAAYLLKVTLFGKATSLSHGAAYRILYNIRLKVADKLARLPMGYYSEKASGKIKKVMLEDVEQLERFLAHYIPETTSNLVIPIVLTVYLFMLDWRMALFMLLTIPLTVLAFMLMMRGYKEKTEKYHRSAEEMNETIVEYINGISVIKAFNQTSESYKKYSGSIRTYQKFVLDWFKSCWPYMSAYFVIMPANLVAVLPAGAYFYLNGSLDLSVFILFIVISMGFSSPIIKLTEFMDGISLVTASESRINDILQEKELLNAQKEGTVPPDYSISFSDVRFSYGDTETIKGISFFAEKGTSTALVGPSGSGKSTLAKLLARFWDLDSGRIDIGGVNIRDIPIEQLMEKVGFVFQDVFLFDVSIKENIRMGRRDATDEEVIEAAKLAQCHDFIMKTDNGYDTFIGDFGNRLSGGEKQRISIARAILRNAPVIVLDEATSSIDPENEDKIQEAINNLTCGKTLIVIAHRLSTIINCDQILVVDDGEVEAKGRHEELLEKCPLYRSMWEAHVETMGWTFEAKGAELNA